MALKLCEQCRTHGLRGWCRRLPVLNYVFRGEQQPQRQVNSQNSRLRYDAAGWRETQSSLSACSTVVSTHA